MKFRVSLEYVKYLEVEADNEQEAIRKATIIATNDSNDFFTAEDEIANRLSERFVDGFEDWEKDLIKKSDRSKQALKDIEEIINHCDNQDICTLCKNADKCRDKYDYTAYNDHKLLLKIIKEVKNE